MLLINNPKKKKQESKLLMDHLHHVMTSYTSPNLILSGDFNQYILGSSSNNDIHAQSYYWNIPTQSFRRQGKTSKPAKELLQDLEHIGLRVLNGRFAEDSPSVASFNSGNATSTIDYTQVSLPLFHHILGFILGDKGDSDHRPQEVSFLAFPDSILANPIGPHACHSINLKRIKTSVANTMEVLQVAKLQLNSLNYPMGNPVTLWETFTAEFANIYSTTVRHFPSSGPMVTGKISSTQKLALKNHKKAINKSLRSLRTSPGEKDLLEQLRKHRADLKKLKWEVKRSNEDDFWA